MRTVYYPLGKNEGKISYLYVCLYLHRLLKGDVMDKPINSRAGRLIFETWLYHAAE